jgi:hypothetical protein
MHMYRTAKSFVALIWISLMLVSAVSVGQRNSSTESPAVVYDLLTNDYNGFTIEITCPEPQLRKQKTADGEYFHLLIPGTYPATSLGQPDLPAWNRMIEIPIGASYEIEVSNVITKEIRSDAQYRAMQVMPVQPPRPKSTDTPMPWVKDEAVYNSNDWFSYGFVRIEAEGVMRNARIARLSVSPVEYHPVQGKLRYVASATVSVKFKGVIPEQTDRWKAAFHSPAMDASVYTLNGAIFTPPPPAAPSPVKFIILSDPMFQATLQPYITWKKEKGFEVIEVYKGNTGVGTTNTSMKSHLQSIYNAASATNPAPTYLLIVGDVQQIPAFTGVNGNHSTDLYYAEFTNDIFPEMFYGRFSATNTADLQSQIDKTLHVEKYLMVDPGFLKNMILVAGDDATYASIWANGQVNYAESEYVNTTNNLIPHSYLYPSSSSQAAQIIQQFNEGASIVNYTAHGSSSGWAGPSFTSTTVGTLTNAGRYPTVISNACQTNVFNINSCFGETLLRASNKGAVGHIGASNNTYWNEDYYFAVGLGPIGLYTTYPQSGPGFFDKLFHSHGEPFPEWAVTQGAIIHAGNMAVTQSASSVDYYWEIYHLMGDPSLMPYLGLPSQITASVPPTLPTGLTQVLVQSAPYTYVAISANGVLHGAALADVNGAANITIAPFAVPTTAKVVITGQNRIPYYDSIQFVIPTGPYVLADSISFRDISGNNNQHIDAGEPIQMDVRLKNFTTFSAGTLTAKLICTDPYITLTDSVANISAIGGLNTWFGLSAFTFQVADFVPDQHAVSAIIRIEDGTSNQWITPVHFILNSAVISIHSVVISDLAGNGNGKIESGESFDFLVRIQNKGHSPLQILSVNLEQNNFYIQLNGNAVTIPQFEPGQTYNLSFSATASTHPIPKGSVVKIKVLASKNFYKDSLTTYVMLIPIAEDFETGNFSSFPWTLTGSQPWFTTTDSPFEGTTCSRSGAIPNQSSTSMSVTIPVISRDSISFMYKVSSELDYDFLKFMVDQVETGAWSGQQLTWQQAKFPIDSGSRTFTWSYTKDYYYEEGMDCAWIDYIIFPATSLYTSIEQPDHIPAMGVEIYPNPSNGAMKITINSTIEEEGMILLMGYDGRILLQRPFATSERTIHFEPGNLASGIYLLVIETPSGIQTRKIIRL